MDANENLKNTTKGCERFNDCSKNGVCVDERCVCLYGYTGVDCATVAQGPESSRCPNSCSSHGTCLFGKCFCDPGYQGQSCNEVTPCSLCVHGICLHGKCECHEGWKGDSCQDKTTNVTATVSAIETQQQEEQTNLISTNASGKPCSSCEVFCMGIGFFASIACFLIIFCITQLKSPSSQKRHTLRKPLLGS
eukprot:TRINITY_DN2235_c0_g1_i2.p1 TRINITY_DN2235_c0_g1~~TRINITY_DN2235_c0_g1_i2.p1  ORF type:complete len:192 (+),score=9.69 TRINITY_DN2235_c0_g1_i2:364-939(+)